jgi:hypothetical protein
MEPERVTNAPNVPIFDLRRPGRSCGTFGKACVVTVEIIDR